jgi:hypothetical protein
VIDQAVTALHRRAVHIAARRRPARIASLARVSRISLIFQPIGWLLQYHGVIRGLGCKPRVELAAITECRPAGRSR